MVTVNFDDPSYFGGYLSENFARCTAALGLTLAETAQLARNSFAASFLPQVDRARQGAAKGFKSGSFQGAPGTAASAAIPYDPEFAWSHEAGAKTQWLV